MNIDIKLKQIADEKKKIQVILKDMSKDKLKVVNGLIDQAAFMKATLADLQEQINADVTAEHFEQGKQKFMRESIAIKTYNTMIKNYSSVMKQLIELTPNQVIQQTDDLLNFIGVKK